MSDAENRNFMSKETYLEKLRKNLRPLEQTEIEDIVLEIEQHFSHAYKKGETDQEIIAKLGSPELLATEHLSASFFRPLDNPDKKNNLHPPVTKTVEYFISFLKIAFIAAPITLILLFIPLGSIFSVLISLWVAFLLIMLLVLLSPFFLFWPLFAIAKTSILFSLGAIFTTIAIIGSILLIGIILSKITQVIVLTAIKFFKLIINMSLKNPPE